jgi:hypothetical protein
MCEEMADFGPPFFYNYCSVCNYHDVPAVVLRGYLVPFGGGRGTTLCRYVLECNVILPPVIAHA